MTSSCSCGVSELRIVWFLRNDFLKVEYSKQANKSTVKRKQEWSYQQCNLVWYQSETILKILSNFFLPSTKVMSVLGQALYGHDRYLRIVLARSFDRIWQDRSGKIALEWSFDQDRSGMLFLSRSFRQDLFGKIVLARSFWQDRFGKIVLERSFWKDRSGKMLWQDSFRTIVLPRSFWQDRFGKIVLARSF